MGVDEGRNVLGKRAVGQVGERVLGLDLSPAQLGHDLGQSAQHSRLCQLTGSALVCVDRLNADPLALSNLRYRPTHQGQLLAVLYAGECFSVLVPIERSAPQS